jgi:hypothetical protein
MWISDWTRREVCGLTSGVFVNGIGRVERSRFVNNSEICDRSSEISGIRGVFSSTEPKLAPISELSSAIAASPETTLIVGYCVVVGIERTDSHRIQGFDIVVWMLMNTWSFCSNQEFQET